eukprot:TRINITY_DN1537_c0_g1_i14.p1 TRINITY_DN1537_c0_g1~~TRINITY_DN1537_c0_g1_i14.p1  ORF type:complete len:284 (+),score=53.81 TRINITY_DN1537_c0_g1_i14:90-854(+)
MPRTRTHILRGGRSPQSANMASNSTVPFTGTAWKFGGIGGSMIEGATISLLDANGNAVANTTTDKNGAYSFPAVAPGTNVTVRLTKTGYLTTQTSTVTVPSTGLTGIHQELTVQVPNILVYEGLKAILHDVGQLDPTKCHFCVTVCAANKTLHDLPQGEPNATVTMDGVVAPDTYYFGVFHNYTNPFKRGLNSTSFDGGVLIFNVPQRAEPYAVTAHKEGKVFTTSYMHCTNPGMFINGSPPWGPIVVSGETEK